MSQNLRTTCDGCRTGLDPNGLAEVLTLFVGDAHSERLDFCDEACAAIYFRRKWREKSGAGPAIRRGPGRKVTVASV